MRGKGVGVDQVGFGLIAGKNYSPVKGKAFNQAERESESGYQCLITWVSIINQIAV